MRRRRLPPAKQYLCPEGNWLLPRPVGNTLVGKSLLWLTSEQMQARAISQMELVGRNFPRHAEWVAAGAEPPRLTRWDLDPTYFAPAGRGNQLREYRLPQQGRKSVRGKPKPTTDDLLNLI